ncbi:MAG: hypothetical protein COZ09_02440 [Comamonadaceae bacterium CG_4_10_14_3_um_filter_60_42]|nr:MAG: hypothetical protein COZ09_02440 [Comamonadaceae bacterium CG_4_10_14_3_um_filter_60_42]
MHPKWSSKFELKPGKWIFVPTAETVIEGRKIKLAIKKKWKPPSYYFHLKAGGHVEALRTHMEHDNFLRIDIRDFFGSINRTRVTRCLKDKFGYGIARSYANASTVPDPVVPKRFIIPFGFVQSQIIAAVCLEESALGIYLNNLSSNPAIALTVYVDDIIVSTSDKVLLDQVLTDIEVAAKRANFTLNADKQEGPAAAITAFNIVLAKDSMVVDASRMKKFEEAFATATSESQRAGIKSYVTSVNASQALATFP